jgi:hypothetical protein
MTRLELLTIVVRRARSNGFEFRRWYTGRLGLPWVDETDALAHLDTQRRYYALLFSHEFAFAFWKAGQDISFRVPSQTFQRTMPDGSIGTVTRKAFVRRSGKKDAWRYHLREMALAEDPLRHIRKYLNVEEDIDIEETNLPPLDKADLFQSFDAEEGPATPKRGRSKPMTRSLPTGTPDFLRRRYP